jgi:hypothetical protein
MGMESTEFKVQPLSTTQLKEVLQRLPQLAEFKWMSSIPPPDGVCEVNQHLF